MTFIISSDINALADVEIGRTGSFLLQLFRNSLWIDRVLYPAALGRTSAVSRLVAGAVEKSAVYRFSGLLSWGARSKILRRQGDYAPRYFLVMLVPVIITLIITLQELNIRNRSLAPLLAATLGVAVVLDTVGTWIPGASPISVLRRGEIHPGNRRCQSKLAPITAGVEWRPTCL